MRFNFEKRIFRISINPGDGLQFFLKNGMYLILKLKDLLKNSGSKSVNGSGPGLEPGGLVPLHVRVVFPRQTCPRGGIGSLARFRIQFREGVWVRVPPRVQMGIIRAQARMLTCTVTHKDGYSNRISPGSEDGVKGSIPFISTKQQ